MEVLKRGSKGTAVKILLLVLKLNVDGIFGPATELAVKLFLKDNNLVVDGIVGNNTWKKLGIMNIRDIKEIIVHCSATPEGRDYTVSDIKLWHLARGFNDVGYHYIIYRDGSIHQGRKESVAGAHCEGHNTNSIGVCYIGGCAKDGKTPKDTRTESLKTSLLVLLKELKSKYPKAKIYPHFKFAAKACPCFNAEEEYKNI